MNGKPNYSQPGKTLDYSNSREKAADIEEIANKVDFLFDEVINEKNKTFGSWGGSAADEAFQLFESYRSNFEAFIEEIRANAQGIKNTCDLYTRAEETVNQTTESASRIQR